jgi:glucokinase
MILAGDIGPTRTRLAAFETDANKLKLVVEKAYLSQKQAGIAEIIAEFVKTEGIPVDRACLGVAGPVRNGKSQISNLTWVIDARELAKQLRLPTVGLINDMEAYAYGIDALESKDFVTLSEGSEDAEGNRAVISARTGLGVAGLYWDGFRHHPFASEGGHTGFAPSNDLEVELLRYLGAKFGGHVSRERVVSGPGIKNIYDFLRDTKREEEPQWLKDQISAAPDAPPVISKLAMEGKSSICEKALSMFISIYGSETGNCALTYMSTGGIFVGGSITSKIVSKMKEAAFMQSFLGKGRMQPLLQSIPVKIVMNDDSGLIGAARHSLIQKAFGKGSRSLD